MDEASAEPEDAVPAADRIPPRPPVPEWSAPPVQPAQPVAPPQWQAPPAPAQWQAPSAPPQWNAPAAQQWAATAQQWQTPADGAPPQWIAAPAQQQWQAPGDATAQQWPTTAVSFAAPYAPPAQGSFAEPPSRRSRTAGIIALIAGLAAVATSLGAAVSAFQIGLGTGPRFQSPGTQTDLSFLTPVRDWVLLGEVCFWVGTALGIWAIVQGIVAAATARGRAPGIAGLVVAVLGPVIFFAVAAVALGLGVDAGSSIAG